MSLVNKKLIFAIFLVAFFALTFTSSYAQTTQNNNAGFIKASIWYSKDPFAEGDKIKIYSFVFNPDQRKLEGSVIFFDGSVFLGKANFTAQANSVKNVSIEWTVTAGDHSIFAKIENSRFLATNGTYQDVYLVGNETDKSFRTVPKTIVPVQKKEVNVGAQAGGNNVIPNDQNLPTVSVAKIKDTIIGITPNFVANPIIATANKFEEIRGSMSIASENKKLALKKEITNPAPKSNGFMKPWQQVQLFFVTLFAFIVAYPVLFYLFWIVFILLIIRFIRRQFAN